MKLLFRALLSFNAIMLLIMIYFVKEKIWIPYLNACSVIVYILLPVLLSGICLQISGLLRTDTIEGGIRGVEMANDSYLPAYLGYFFVALSIPSSDPLTMWFVFGVLFVFTLFSQTMYYNPLFLLFGYQFYYVTKGNGMRVFIITKREIPDTKNLCFRKLKRINDFTYIDKEPKNGSGVCKGN